MEKWVPDSVYTIKGVGQNAVNQLVLNSDSVKARNMNSPFRDLRKACCQLMKVWNKFQRMEVKKRNRRKTWLPNSLKLPVTSA